MSANSIQDVISDLIRIYLIKRGPCEGGSVRIHIPKAVRRRILDGLNRQISEGQKAFDRAVELIRGKMFFSNKDVPSSEIRKAHSIFPQVFGLQETFDSFNPPLKGHTVFIELLVTTGECLHKMGQTQEAGPLLLLAKELHNREHSDDVSLQARVENLSALISASFVCSEDLQRTRSTDSMRVTTDPDSPTVTQEVQATSTRELEKTAFAALRRWKKQTEEDIVDEWLEDSPAGEDTEVITEDRTGDSMPTREMVFA